MGQENFEPRFDWVLVLCACDLGFDSVGGRLFMEGFCLCLKLRWGNWGLHRFTRRLFRINIASALCSCSCANLVVHHSCMNAQVGDPIELWR